MNAGRMDKSKAMARVFLLFAAAWLLRFFALALGVYFAYGGAQAAATGDGVMTSVGIAIGVMLVLPVIRDVLREE